MGDSTCTVYKHHKVTGKDYIRESVSTSTFGKFNSEMSLTTIDSMGYTRESDSETCVAESDSEVYLKIELFIAWASTVPDVIV